MKEEKDALNFVAIAQLQSLRDDRIITAQNAFAEQQETMWLRQMLDLDQSMASMKNRENVLLHAVWNDYDKLDDIEAFDFSDKKSAENREPDWLSLKEIDTLFESSDCIVHGVVW